MYSVNVLADTPDYRFVLHRNKIPSSTLLVTFDVITSGISDNGFGTKVAIKNSIDNLYVSQREFSSYQCLSREEFNSITQEVFVNYENVLFYGHSLGGYASLYYSFGNNVSVFSICPRCPAHFYFRNLRAYASYNEPFKHEVIEKSQNSNWVVLWDPKNIDNGFVEDFIKFERIDRVIKIPNLGHGNAPKILTVNNSLQNFLREWFSTGGAFKDLPAPYLEFESNYLLLNKKAKNYETKGLYTEALELFKKSYNIFANSAAEKSISRVLKKIV